MEALWWLVVCREWGGFRVGSGECWGFYGPPCVFGRYGGRALPVGESVYRVDMNGAWG